MNIEEIKRNIRYGTLNTVETQNVNKQIKEIVKPLEPRNKEINVKKFIQPHEEEEEEKANSKVWEDEGYVFDVYKSVEMIISSLELDNDVYDWRREKKKGKRSRKNFTDFLVESI